jgi:hypothetical protein
MSIETGTEIGCTRGPDRQECGGGGETDADREADEPRASISTAACTVSSDARRGHDERSPVFEGRNTPTLHLYSPALGAARYAADVGGDAIIERTLRVVRPCARLAPDLRSLKSYGRHL